jgi:hypothetical protein
VLEGTPVSFDAFVFHFQATSDWDEFVDVVSVQALRSKLAVCIFAWMIDHHFGARQEEIVVVVALIKQNRTRATKNGWRVVGS